MPAKPKTTTDAALDKQYRLGFEQAWREWSSIISTDVLYPEMCKARTADVQRMEQRLIEVQKR